ncbi:hypothetical protein PYW08_016182 [Mythimna loreyi]|uniref:Uncharacterized protein n=1 Tax=Mythimna loreyi TaxID=667449 RepID=A0ACC2QXZ6_9NEOP|nr:hypothetical protein PYW08_016182 [Mythimna loreyi]
MDLDLTNNSLTLLREDDLRTLLADSTRRVRLARNPLVCNCSAAATLTLMQARQAALDYDALTCANGSRLATVRPLRCSRGLDAALVAAVAALVTLLAAAALAGLLWHPALRLRLKVVLHQRGWLPALTDQDDDDRRFDVFLSFSHGDERFVRDELVARLESGPAPYRLCVHYRDWVPGGWIPAQIAASVRASRRTVAVVSAHFLRSAWARAEFQEAYALALRDARPRLVVVLLDDPSALPLDDKLRSYLSTNTYVRWGDPWFWHKLRLALPRSRGPLAGNVPLESTPPDAVTPEACSESAASPLNSASSTPGRPAARAQAVPV